MASRGVDREREMEEIIRELVGRDFSESDAWRLQLLQSVIERHTRQILADAKPKMPPPLQRNRLKLRPVKPRIL